MSARKRRDFTECDLPSAVSGPRAAEERDGGSSEWNALSEPGNLRLANRSRTTSKYVVGSATLAWIKGRTRVLIVGRCRRHRDLLEGRLGPVSLPRGILVRLAALAFDVYFENLRGSNGSALATPKCRPSGSPIAGLAATTGRGSSIRSDSTATASSPAC